MKGTKPTLVWISLCKDKRNSSNSDFFTKTYVASFPNPMDIIDLQ